jgi:lantibiotic modifying enzyme
MFIPAAFMQPVAFCDDERPYLEAGLKAGEWLKAVAVRTGDGLVWPVDPANPATVDESLYSGNPGVVLYFLEARSVTGEEEYLEYARGGANHLLAEIEGIENNGLYTGLAGIGYVLAEVHKATGEEKYREGALRCAELIRSHAVAAGGGVEWDGTTDIISGAAGTGLFLLWAAKELGDEAALETATAAGRRLMEVGIPAGGGTKWAMRADFPRLMPNFSHGTAGVAYFLARLYEETGDRTFLEAALSGAEYLKSIANTEGGGCLIFHHEPDGEDLFYLGWCHGPVGTARLFYKLYQLTGEEAWREWMTKGAEAILASGIPEQQTPGFWNNVGICCGSAGVAKFFMDLYQQAGEERDLEFCRRVADDMVARGMPEGGGLKWIQAEHRSDPSLLIAQTGLMQGAAGIGLVLFQLEEAMRGEKAAVVVLPDTPF